MTSIRGTREFPTTDYSAFSPAVGALLDQQRKALSALRVYRRRGWNDAAVIHQLNRLRDSLARELEREEYEWQNPTLFE